KHGSLVEEMRQGFTSIQAGLSDLHSEVSSINSKIDKISQHLDASERRIGDLEDTISKIWWPRRRSNLRIVGLPEGKDPVAFVEKALVEVLGEATFPGLVEIERAHRALRPRPREGERPRIIIFKLLRFPDKVRILRRAREMGQLTYQNQRMIFFLDVSAELQAKRHEFTEARCLCHSLQIPFSLLHPAKLRVSLKEGPKFFVDPVEAVSFLKQLPAHLPALAD
uniref:L1 transposable element RRM domain-containing protein n=1 Tax=Latimeria chalumnae TaxID=7897 RepID=H3AQT8_LATCH